MYANNTRQGGGMGSGSGGAMTADRVGSEGGIVGVDVGGTFTDLILIYPQAKNGAGVRIAKVPTTPDNQAFGVLAALDAAHGATGADLAGLGAIIHGTTATTNALLERKIARCGLITTRGFRDVLELGRRTRPKPYGLTGQFVPLIPRELRIEVDERMDAEGRVVRPLDEAGFSAAVRHLIAAGAEALVIHFLHSYINPAHEQRAAELARGLWPNSHVTAGHAVLAEYREYERGVTATINAAIQPVLARYLGRLGQELTQRGYRRELLVMQGNGGTVAASIVAEAAVNTVMSGPASGVMAAAYTARAAGIADVVTYDMGGTSTDVGLIRGGLPEVSSELELEYAMPVHVPMVDVHTIGAGGGSLAWIDDAGLLRVGPESAGARPGPICYGRGGTRPTITDADLVLGRLDPAKLLAVDRQVSLEQVRQAIGEQIGQPLGLDVEGAAAAIVRIADDRMAGAIRMVSLARGHDPRDFVLFAFGGAGPLHAAALAAELGIPRLLIPARPGITNALGCIVADLRHDFVNTLNKPLDRVDMADVHRVLAEQVARGKETIQREGVAVEGYEIVHGADMQFQGQSHLMSVPIGRGDIDRAELQSVFERAYWQRFAVELPEIKAVLVNLHTAVIGKRRPVPLETLVDPKLRKRSVAEAETGRRKVWFAGSWRDTPIYRREFLPLGPGLAGPAIVEQLDTTIVIPPGATGETDRFGNLVVSVPAAGRA